MRTLTQEWLPFIGIFQGIKIGYRIAQQEEYANREQQGIVKYSENQYFIKIYIIMHLSWRISSILGCF